MNADKDVSFKVSGGTGKRRGKFNIDGSEAMHVDVWVEALADKWFWLEYLRDNSDFKFSVKGPDEKDAKDDKKSTGCDRLFALEKQKEIVLGVDCIFCLDSDDSFIKSLIEGYKSLKKPRKHVYVTNIYAIDNAYLIDDHVDHSFSQVTTKGSQASAHPPSTFINGIATTLWNAYTGIYYLEGTAHAKQFNLSLKQANNLIEKLNKVNIDNYPDCSTYKKFIGSAAKLEKRVFKALNSIGIDNYKKFLQKLSDADVNVNNFYLFIRGHNLFDATTAVYEKVNDRLKKTEIARVKADYEDFEHKVTCIESSWSTFPNFLITKFSAYHTSVPFLERTLTQISNDYNLSH
jgi:hypothetical protein